MGKKRKHDNDNKLPSSFYKSKIVATNGNEIDTAVIENTRYVNANFYYQAKTSTLTIIQTNQTTELNKLTWKQVQEYFKPNQITTKNHIYQEGHETEEETEADKKEYAKTWKKFKSLVTSEELSSKKLLSKHSIANNFSTQTTGKSLTHQPSIKPSKRS